MLIIAFSLLMVYGIICLFVKILENVHVLLTFYILHVITFWYNSEIWFHKMLMITITKKLFRQQLKWKVDVKCEK